MPHRDCDGGGERAGGAGGLGFSAGWAKLLLLLLLPLPKVAPFISKGWGCSTYPGLPKPLGKLPSSIGWKPTRRANEEPLITGVTLLAVELLSCHHDASYDEDVYFEFRFAVYGSPARNHTNVDMFCTTYGVRKEVSRTCGAGRAACP